MIDNRIIKFRAWIPDEELLLTIPCTDGDHISELTDDELRIVRYNDYIVKESGGNIIETEGYEPCDAYIMQFTGCHDKNGKEVYEGDVFNTPSGIKYKVIFDRGCFAITNLYEYYPSQHVSQIADQWEIIGNIYENPELLNENVGMAGRK